MAKMRENKYLCDMDFTQSDQCFRNKYDVNINTNTVHDSRVMLLLSRGGHLSVYQDGNISTDLVRNFCLRTDCFRDLFTQRYSSFSTAQGEVNLPHAALERVKAKYAEIQSSFRDLCQGGGTLSDPIIKCATTTKKLLSTQK